MPALRKVTPTTNSTMNSTLNLRGLNLTLDELVYMISTLGAQDKQLLYEELGLNEEEFEEMYVRLWESELMNIPYYRLSKQLLCYVPPVLLIIGTIGNLLSFLVLMRKPMRRVSAYMYLSVLSITDIFVLYIGLLPLWIGEISGVDIRDYSDWTCKLINVLGYTASDYSVWLLIGVTVERYIATVHSLHASTMCRLSRARKVIVGIFLLLFAINCHFFATTEVVTYNTTLEGVPTCDAVDNFKTLVIDVWPWIDAIIYSFLPFVVIMTLNGTIIYNVAKAGKGRSSMTASRSMRSTGGSSTNTAYHLHNHNNQLAHPNNRPVARPSHHEHSTKITVMLLTISFTFLVTTLPMNLSSIVSALAGSHAENTREASKYKLARTVTELLMYTNHSINFFLYLLTGQKFRQQLNFLLCKLCRKSSSWGESYYSRVGRKTGHFDKSNGVDKHLQLPTEMTLMTDDRLSIRSNSKSSSRD